MERATIASPPATVEITRTFDAPREKVFRAWTEGRELACWFAPSPDYHTVVPTLELRKGGRYVVEMHHKSGKVRSVAGTYREVAPPEKISFTWAWQSPEPGPESLVTIYFRDAGKATEIRLVHELLATEEERTQHGHGWHGCFEQLAGYL